MIPFPRRLEHAVERLDAPVHDDAELEASLDDVAAVNRWLGGWTSLLENLGPLLPAGRTARILDVGTGSADIPRRLVDWARQNGRRLRVVAVDLHAETVRIARRRTAAYPEIEVQRADALALPYADRAFDVALLTLTLHHFEGEDQLRALRELWRVARRGIVVGELERCWPNYLGARLLAATLWRKNRLTRHDGPLSVRRAFTRRELLDLARRVGLDHPRVSRHFFHRLVLRATKERPAWT